MIAKEAHNKYKEIDLGVELIKICNKILTPWKILFRKTLPSQETHPLACFTVIMIYSFLFTRFIVNCVDSIIDLFNVSPSFVGLTLSSWGGNISGKITNNIENCIFLSKLLILICKQNNKRASLIFSYIN